MKMFLFSALALFVAACSTNTVKPTASEPAPRERRDSSRDSESAEVNIDYNSLQRSLGLDRSRDQLGYQEKSFDTCQAGYGYSSAHNCRKQVFVVINFQLKCRNSEGTVANGVTQDELDPIADRPVKWSLKGAAGLAQTDGQGYGQIRTVSANSQRQQRLKLALGNEFLYMKANEITQVVTPQPWCSQ